MVHYQHKVDKSREDIITLLELVPQKYMYKLANYICDNIIPHITEILPVPLEPTHPITLLDQGNLYDKPPSYQKDRTISFIKGGF